MDDVLLVRKDMQGRSHLRWVEPLEAVECALFDRENGVKWQSSHIYNLAGDGNGLFDMSFVNLQGITSFEIREDVEEL